MQLYPMHFGRTLYRKYSELSKDYLTARKYLHDPKSTYPTIYIRHLPLCISRTKPWRERFEFMD